MENKEIKVILKKVDEKDVLIFKLNVDRVIDLNDKEQATLKDVFYDLIKTLFTNKIVLKLEVDVNYENSLFKEISEEYIDQLQQEINSVFDSLPISIDSKGVEEQFEKENNEISIDLVGAQK